MPVDAIATGAIRLTPLDDTGAPVSIPVTFDGHVVGEAFTMMPWDDDSAMVRVATPLGTIPPVVTMTIPFCNMNPSAVRLLVGNDVVGRRIADAVDGAVWAPVGSVVASQRHRRHR